MRGEGFERGSHCESFWKQCARIFSASHSFGCAGAFSGCAGACDGAGVMGPGLSPLSSPTPVGVIPAGFRHFSTVVFAVNPISRRDCVLYGNSFSLTRSLLRRRGCVSRRGLRWSLCWCRRHRTWFYTCSYIAGRSHCRRSVTLFKRRHYTRFCCLVFAHVLRLPNVHTYKNNR